MTVNTEKIAECNQRIYQNAVEKLDEGKYCEAKRIFETLGDYSDSETMVQECDYRYGNELLTGLKYDLAYTVLEGISGYQDSATIIENSKSDRYDDAIASMDAGDYTDAVETFTALKDYSDSKNKITTCKYRIAMGYMETGEYAEAKTVLEDISDYENSSDLILECIYQIGITELENGEYDQAYADFESISEYNDSSVKMLEVKYQNAISLIVSEEYEDAISLFSEITYYKDSAKKITDVQKTIYEDAKTFMDEKDYKKALALFEYLDEYGDSKDMVYEAKYMIGVSYISEKNFDKAFAILEELDDKRAKSFQSELSATDEGKAYDQAQKYMKDNCFYQALYMFKEAKGYKDADAIVENIENDVEKYYLGDLTEAYKLGKQGSEEAADRSLYEAAVSNAGLCKQNYDKLYDTLESLSGSSTVNASDVRDYLLQVTDYYVIPSIAMLNAIENEDNYNHKYEINFLTYSIKDILRCTDTVLKELEGLDKIDKATYDKVIDLDAYWLQSAAWDATRVDEMYFSYGDVGF